MRAVFQRVQRAEVRVQGECIGRIGAGGLVLLGVRRGDTDREALQLAAKVARLRVFEDERGVMNLPVTSLPGGGALLVVSQFTLYGDASKGNRPSYIEAAPPEEARRLYERFVAELRRLGIAVETGRFQATMEVELVNDGPVTLCLHIDSAKEC